MKTANSKMLMDDEEETIAYPMPGELLEPTKTSTPVVKKERMETPAVERHSWIDFDDLSPVKEGDRKKTDELKPKLKLTACGNYEERMTSKKTSFRERTDDAITPTRNLRREFGERTEEPMDRGKTEEATALIPSLLESVGGLLRSRPMAMKPGKFDGTGSLESFLVQFEVCAKHNRWTSADKSDHLRCSLEKAATQLLWDFGAQPSASYEDLVERLRQRYGTEGQAETFRAQLYYRRQRSEESLSDLLHEIRRLVVLAYPVPANETTQIIARDAFLEAMSDRELSLKVREREPKTIDEAYRSALRLDAYRRTADTDDRRRPPNRVRGTREDALGAQLQMQMDRFLATQREEQRKWQRELESKFDLQFRQLRQGTPTHSDEPSRNALPERDRPGSTENTRRTTTCFNCGRAGHIARNCRQPRRFQTRPNEIATAGTEASPPPTPETVAANHTISPKEPNRATKNAIYIRGEINGRPQLCLIDTGSEVSLVPSSTVTGLEIQSCNRFLMAANGSDIRVLGEVRVPIKIWKDFYIHTSFLVSDQITEPMLGMDWLREHRCRLGFGMGSLFVRRRRIPLVRGNGSTWCRRVIVAEEVVVSPKCQIDIPVKTLYGDLTTVAPAWMTEAREIQPGVHLARVVVGNSAETQVRVVNLNDGPVRLPKDQSLGGLHPVEVSEVIRKSVDEADQASPNDEMLANLPEEVPFETRERLSALLTEFKDIFSASDRDLGRTSVAMHRIETGDARPVRQPLRRQPLPHRTAIDSNLDSMLADGIIEPTVSEWAANVVLARKKDGNLRFCIDYRQLNDRTKKDSYPLPRIDECLDALAGGGWFSTLDLRSGYHQVAMDPNDADKTAFVTRRGIFKWKVMPFGLCNAPATFQRLMDIVLSGLNFEICLVYLDDVIIFGSTPEEHLDRLEKVFQRLRGANLKLKPSKCQLLRRSVGFLGHIVTPEGVAMDPSKVKDVVEWPVPQKLRDVRAFLGLCSYYRRFVKDFSTVAAPLFALTKKGRMFVWDEVCQETFDRLKTALTTAPILALPKDEGTYVLDCDACDEGIGAVLSQRIGTDERVIAYGSRLLSNAERNYCVTRKELLAVVYFSKLYRQYLLGRSFVLRTDHAALQWLQRTPEPIGQQGRWLERLAEFDFQIVHRPGRNHGNADALSRRPCRQCGLEDPVTVAAVIEISESAPPSIDDDPLDHIEEIQREDPDLRIVRSWLGEGAEAPDLVEILPESETVKVYWYQKDSLYLQDGKIYRRTPEGVNQLVIPRAKREEFLKLAHTGVTGGHLGIRRTRWQVRRRAYWVGWSGDVRRFCKRCSPCNQYRRGLPPKQGPLQPLPCGEPWERLSLDITGPHPRSRRGHIYILTVMDGFSKFVEAIPMANQEASSVARALVDNVIVRYGAPLEILTDQGKNFEGNLFKELCRLLDIDKVRTSSYHPSCNGLIERFHRTMNSMIGKVVSSHQREWDEILPYVLSAYRASQHETTGFSPNYLMFGRETRAPIDLVYGRPPTDDTQPATYSAYTTDLAERMEGAYRQVREHLRVSAERRKRRYDLKVRPARFAPGDRVWYFTPRRYQGRSPKWMRMFTGPFTVVEQIGLVNFRIKKSRQSRPFVVHVDKLRHCYPEGLDSAEEIDATDDREAMPSVGLSTTSRNDASAPSGPATTTERPRRATRPPLRYQ